MGPDSRGRPLGRWKDRVKEYMCERQATRREGSEQARREMKDRVKEYMCERQEEAGHQGYRTENRTSKNMKK